MISMSIENLNALRKYLEDEFDARPTQAQLEDAIDFMNELSQDETGCM